MADGGNVTYIFDLPSGSAPVGLATPGGPRSESPAADAPIARLRDRELHGKVLEKLRSMWKMSEREMKKFHTRWRDNEMQYQAYLNAKTIEEARRATRGQGTPPELITLTVPYSYAAVQTIVTYLLHTFTGRKPMFQVGAHRGDIIKLSQNLETLLQYNGDHEQIIRKLYQFFLDGEMYGVHVLRTLWKTEERRRTVWRPQNPFGAFGGGSPVLQQVKETVVTFEGNDIYNVDPFRFYPDPRVPMDQVAKRGEFVFWETYEGKHSLKKAEASGAIAYVDNIPDMPTQLRTGLSERNRLADGDDGGISSLRSGDVNIGNFYHLMQGSVEIVPSQWGLGDSDHYEKWLFTVANDAQIVQAEPLDADHDTHPVIVGEPYSSGYGFGHTSVTDFMAPMQDMLSWMINSHIFNVRSTLNNTLVVNPQMVDMADLKKPGPGRVIKLTPLAFGQNPANAVYQLPVQDITRTHITDMSVVQRFADMISATTDNVRGQTQQGGRKTATEVRSTGEGSASRLGAHARFISAQSICPLAEVMTINYQQNMSQEVYLQVLGAKAQETPIRPEDIASGNFYFPVHDGTLPLDRVALLDVWREIFMAIIGNPGLAQIFDAVGIFQYIADLGGAKNLSLFKIQTASNDAVARAVQAGNLVPAPQAAAA